MADLANDLKNVINLLPVSQQKTPLQDPHSTQPDLPEIYDAIVAAKERANQDGPMPPVPIQPMSASTTCPRCGNPLAANAAFCPRCGASISNVVNIQASSSKARVHTIAPDQTVFMTHEQMMQGATASGSQQSPGIARSTTMSAPGTSRPDPTVQHQHNGNGSTLPATQDGVNNAQQGQSFQQALLSANTTPTPSSNGQVHPKSDYRLLIYFIIALIVLIALVVLFFILIHHVNAKAIFDGIGQPLALLQKM
ncbi:MAG: zinc ribbon domain-containing protein [Ktedonobacteraceae bacterium]|nr:zinc ribbon domain-containing protein [Ktedonobacteraceae bacterium]